MTLRERFEAKVDRRGPDECWPFTGSVGSHGYGQIYVAAGKVTTAHRVAHELYIGPIPEGWDVDHVRARGCQGGRCVNPAHLEAVPPAVNRARHWATVTRCKRGHPYNEANTRYKKHAGNGVRDCRVCHRDRERERVRRKRASDPN